MANGKTFALQTGDPLFDPMEPVTVNGYRFIPAAEHDRRITELLEANNREVERRRQLLLARRPEIEGLSDRIRTVLRRWGVRTHHKETSKAGASRYALFCEGVQVGAVASHAEVQQDRENMIIAEIVSLIEGDA